MKQKPMTVEQAAVLVWKGREDEVPHDLLRQATRMADERLREECRKTNKLAAEGKSPIVCVIPGDEEFGENPLLKLTPTGSYRSSASKPNVAAMPHKQEPKRQPRIIELD